MTLAVEELSRVDLSAGIVVNGQNMLVNNALLRWANERQKERYLPRLAVMGEIGCQAVKHVTVA